jgi:hypothetical protein
MNENPEEATPPVTPKPQKISIDIPKDVPAFYANLAFISHTPAELVLDFAQVLPRMPRGTVKARIIMSPMHAKLLHKALGQNIANYERQFGEIRMPTTIADQFFRFPQQGPDDKQE